MRHSTLTAPVWTNGRDRPLVLDRLICLPRKPLPPTLVRHSPSVCDGHRQSLNVLWPIYQPDVGDYLLHARRKDTIAPGVREGSRELPFPGQGGTAARGDRADRSCAR